MKIISVKINNILSIQEAEIKFDESGLVLVKGWDHDSNRANGAGKTAIFNALCFGLYDKMPRKITTSEILRRGTKNGYVEVIISCSNEVYKVSRSRPKGVKFFCNDNEISITQDEWESKLGLNYNQFMMVGYCSQGSSSRFLSVNDADKKKFILQLLDLDSFTTAKKNSDEIIRNLLVLKDKIESETLSLKSKIEAYSENLLDANSAKQELAELHKRIKVQQDDLNDLLKIEKPDLSKYSSLEDDLINKKNNFINIKAKREVLHSQYRKLVSKDKPFISIEECASCGSILDTSKAIAAHEKESQIIKLEMVDIKSQIDQCDLDLAKEEQLNNLIVKLKNKKREESNDYDAAQNKVNQIRLNLQLLNQKANTLSIKIQQNEQLMNKINSLNEGLKDNAVKSSEYITKIELYETVASIYSPTGAQAYILDSIIELFNKSISEYISQVWDTATYELLSYREKQDGDISAKFSEKFTINGKDTSIGSLSGGEYRALSLCVDFALIDVVERQFGVYISPIILDEPFDGLDSDGRELIVGLLESLSRNRLIIVIDHSSETKSMFSNIISVEKRGGISSLSMQSMI